MVPFYYEVALGFSALDMVRSLKNFPGGRGLNVTLTDVTAVGQHPGNRTGGNTPAGGSPDGIVSCHAYL